jgi:hypothetical protein
LDNDDEGTERPVVSSVPAPANHSVLNPVRIGFRASSSPATVEASGAGFEIPRRIPTVAAQRLLVPKVFADRG